MTIGVGIIGVAPGRSWAAIAHIPALRVLPDFAIVALATTRQESADAAAAELGVPRAYGDYRALVNDPAVDLVVVTVKVPHHLELVTAALEAGKHVLCEWPLGNGLAEAERMASLARDRGVVARVGLQARMAPAFRYVRELVEEGYVGTVLSTTLVGSGMSWGAFIDQPNAYNAEKANGATLLSIPFAHTIDAVIMCLGEFSSISGLMANRRTSFTLLPDGTEQPMDAEDQVAVIGQLEGGAVAAAHYRGGISRATNFRWEINGTDGDIVATAEAGHAQAFPLSLHGARGDEATLVPLDIPESYREFDQLDGFAANVAGLYARLAADIRDGTTTCPTFDDAVHRHRMIDAIEHASASGARLTL